MSITPDGYFFLLLLLLRVKYTEQVTNLLQLLEKPAPAIGEDNS